MLLLIFYSENERFACKAEDVLEVTPNVDLKELNNSDRTVVGAVNYGGLIVPIIDWRMLTKQKPSSNSLHTRIIFVPNKEISNDDPYIGILAERVTTTMDVDLKHFVEPSNALEQRPFLKGIMTDQCGTVQLVDFQALIKDQGCHAKP